MLKQLLVVEPDSNLIDLICWIELLLCGIWIQAEQGLFVADYLRYQHLLEFNQENIEGQMRIS